jgi:hypothetical protein
MVIIPILIALCSSPLGRHDPGVAETVAVPTSESSAGGLSEYDCGTLSLYYFFKCEGRKIQLADLEKALPAPHPHGYSMRELRDAAGSIGLWLSGVHLARTEDAIDSPMLLYVRRGGHGHFIMLRPIGHTGKLVQVFDSSRPPEVFDKQWLLDSPEWTGMALVRGRWRAESLVVFTTTAASLLAALAACRILLRRRIGHA